MIPVYKNEQDIQDKILSSPKILASCQIIPKINKLKIDVDKLSLATEFDPDLYRLYSIMVSTGMNKNDDVFTKRELWMGKETPIDKPLNIEHAPRTIVGHIVESRMINDQYDELDEYDEEDLDEDTYHLLTGGVIYKHLKSVDQDLEKECAKLIEEIDNGEWFVSMECVFADFDYAFIHPVFGKRYVQRNDSTSFLTKYLRMYGGDGNYNGMRIGRVLKGLLFSGKGLVKNPANPNSIILNNVDAFTGTYASLADLNINNDNKESNMAENFEVKYAEAQNEIKVLREQLTQAGEEQQKKILLAKDEEIAQLNETIAALKKKMDEKEEKDKEEAKKKEEDEKCKASLASELQSCRAEITQLKNEKIAIDRVSVLVSAGVNKEEAEKLVERFAGVNDEQFTELVNLQKQLMNVTSATETIDIKEEEVKTEDEAISEEVLEDAEVIEEASLSTEETQEEVDEDKSGKLCASVAQWLNW